MTQSHSDDHIKAMVDALDLHRYTREPITTGKLFAAIKNLIHTFPHMRLGQALANALGPDTDLFNVYDEELVQKIEEFIRAHGDSQP